MSIKKVFLFIFSLFAGVSFGEVSQNRVYLISQHNFGAKTGFYLDFENSSNPPASCTLENLHLILGVADGAHWRFISTSPKWQFGKDYKIKGVIDAKQSELYLDGEMVGKIEGGFCASQNEISLYYIPGWAKGKTDYLIILKDARISDDGESRRFLFPQRDLPLPLLVFAPQFNQTITWQTKGKVEIEAIFEIIPYPDVKTLSPLIDRYGQCKYADWRGKIKSDDDLKNAWEEEKKILNSWGEPDGYDRFGGYKRSEWKEEGTGFYRVIKRNNIWWLITPEGNPCFYTGVCAVPSLCWEMTPVSEREFLFEWLPPKEGTYAFCWNKGVWGDGPIEYVAFHTANMIRKYGDDWQKVALDLSQKRLKVWGFSGIGKFGSMDNFPDLPIITVHLSRGDVPNIVRHPDIFDPSIRERFKETLHRQIEPKKNYSFIVSWSLGNEYSELIRKDEIKQILGMSSDVPVKRALIDYAIDTIYQGNMEGLARGWNIKVKNKEEVYQSNINPPANDSEKMRLFYEDKYHEFIYKTVKEIDPYHLYCGFWIVPGWWEGEGDWDIAAKYCDVIGYDRYSYIFMPDWLSKLLEKANKPILCGEFSYPSFYNGERGFGVYGVWGKDDADSGELYRKWIKDASQNPYCIGVSWFIYRDQMPTGRGLGRVTDVVCGESYAFGMVDVGDRPKWELVSRAREANLSAIKWRLSVSK